jgi:hypothetical protein
MQEAVENFDFDQYYASNGRDAQANPLKFPVTEDNLKTKQLSHTS